MYFSGLLILICKNIQIPPKLNIPEAFFKELNIFRSYNGPYRSSPEHKGSSQRNHTRGANINPPDFDFEDDPHSKYLIDHGRAKSMMYNDDAADSEVLRAQYRRPRDVLLSLIGDFMHRANLRLQLIRQQEEKEWDQERELEKEKHRDKDRDREKDKERDKEREREKPELRPTHFLDIKTHIVS